MHVYSYNQYSAGATALARAAGAKKVKHEGSRFVGGPHKTVINWGSSSVPPEVGRCRVINLPEIIGRVTNKLTFFTNFNIPELVPYTTSVDQVREWLNEGKTVVARKKLTGHSGEGIVILEGTDAEIVPAPLYTLYKPKKDEYRIHVVRTANGYQVFDRQRKARDRSNDNPNWKVRNHENGFVYARDGIDPPRCVEESAIKILEEIGLDFGAVDIIYNDKEKKAYVLEINTAPGLTGTTLERYTAMVKENFE